MSRRLFWQLSFSLLTVSLFLFSSLHHFSVEVTTGMTEISQHDQGVLKQLAEQADKRFGETGEDGIKELTNLIQKDHGVWSALVTANNQIISGQQIPHRLKDKLGFQRQVYWPVHQFMGNVLIGLPVSRHGAIFVIELPEPMRPKVDTSLIHNLLTIVVPSFIMLFFCWLAYRYLMRPLEALNQGAQKLAQGDLSARVLPEIAHKRKDELTQVAASFDDMASRIEGLVNSQRQLLGDLSHELRTPLTRMGLAVDLIKKGDEQADQQLPRLERELEQVHCLVEDALTLAWLDSEPELPRDDAFDLSTLLDLIVEDAEFEFPERKIVRVYDNGLTIENSSQQVLAQTIENVLRNALKYSPPKKSVQVICGVDDNSYRLIVSDQGEGVPESCLEKIFEPFFRTDRARSREQGGFGLGLALCKRQITALGGSIVAKVNAAGGLDIVIVIPSSAQ